MTGDLEQASTDNLNDLLHVAELAETEINYLARVAELADPITDDVDCDTDERPGG